jgi:hypothetical protein
MGDKRDHFIGGAFTWFTGIVEDVNDPEELGRIRVRCFGFHDQATSNIRTEDLPWAFVVGPNVSAGISGIGDSHTGLVSGSMVVGFFRDGISAQDPLILGTIASQSTRDESLLSDEGKGFKDPNAVYPLQTGPDIPIEATSKYQSSNTFKSKQTQVTKVNTTQNLFSLDENTSSPVYPNNRVIHTRSGHVIEYDDTVEGERISIQHKSGSRIEFEPSGKIVIISENDLNSVSLQSKNVYVENNSNIYIGENSIINTKGNTIHNISGNYNLNVDGVFDINVGSTNMNISSGLINITGANIKADKTITATVDVIGGGKSLKSHTHTVEKIRAGTVEVKSNSPD